MDNITIIQKQLLDSRLTPEEQSSLEAQTNGSTPPSSRLRWLKMATSDVDRAGDVMLLAGMDATNFLKNPQYLWQHGMSGATVSTMGTIRKLITSGNALFALAEYATEDISPLAEQIFQLDIAGFLPANSIGFRPIEWEENEAGGRTFTKWELIECSKVELPMNPNAVDSGAAKSLDHIHTLDFANDWLAS
ncbi:MAG TPA: HK97 family phage prohead protease [Candidatus Kapabacteria bacterium]|jgi:hypothetical protein|nr:HK97 family phage prohead protease [Candidatus Kapabacteria bacterium]